MPTMMMTIPMTDEITIQDAGFYVGITPNGQNGGPKDLK